MNVSIAGVASGRVKSHATTGAWSFTSPRLATSVHDVSAVAENRAGIRSAATSLRVTVNGEVHSGTLQKWVAAANAWKTISAQPAANPVTRFPNLAEVRATGNAAELRTIAFTDTVRWIPSGNHVGIASAFTILPLDKAGGAIALTPQPGTVPGKVGAVIIGDCNRDLPTTIMWNAPTDGCGCRSTRYSLEVFLEDGRTSLYNVPSTVNGGSSVDVGAVLSFRIWGATKRGAGEVQASSASSSYAIALESFHSLSRSSCNTCNPSSCPPDICSGYGTPVCCPSGSGSTTCCATGGGR